MRKVIITMSIVLGVALGGIFNIVSIGDVTPNALACGDKDKGASEDTDKTGGSSTET